ncbi:ATP-dependent RNA helicase SrmB [Diplonema papillatum]|nr:ATP-dependent RNA helicase SrmB [Diplonema papillatum]
MRRSAPRLKKWERIAPFHGNPQRKLRETELIRKLKTDDLYRAEIGAAVWLNTTKAIVERMQEAEGEQQSIIRPNVEEDRHLKATRGRRVDLMGLDDTGLEPLVCRALIRQGITELTEIQQRLVGSLALGTDVFATGYTGCGKTFGLSLVLSHRLLSEASSLLPYSFIALFPTTALCYQFEKWVSLFCGTASHVFLTLDSELSPREHESLLNEKKPTCVFCRPQELDALFEYCKLKKRSIFTGRYSRKIRRGREDTRDSGPMSNPSDTSQEVRAVPSDTIGTEAKYITVTSVIRANSRLVLIDEVDDVIPVDPSHPNYDKRRRLLRKLLRMQGGTSKSRDPTPQQQCIFVSATLSHSALSELRQFARTSVVKTEGQFYGGQEHVAGDERQRMSFLNPHSLASYLQSAERPLSRNEPFVIDIHNRVAFSFPATLYHAFATVSTAREVAACIEHVLLTYRQHAFSVPRLPVYPSPPSGLGSELPRSPKAIVFVESHVVSQMVDCLGSMSFSAIPFVGTEGQLASARDAFEAPRETGASFPVLVVPKNSVRGLDFVAVTHCFIVGAPTTTSAYMHLSGRTARNGHHGCCITLLPANRLAFVRGLLPDLDITAVSCATLTCGDRLGIDGRLPTKLRLAEA